MIAAERAAILRIIAWIAIAAFTAVWLALPLRLLLLALVVIAALPFFAIATASAVLVLPIAIALVLLSEQVVVETDRPDIAIASLSGALLGSYANTSIRHDGKDKYGQIQEGWLHTLTSEANARTVAVS